MTPEKKIAIRKRRRLIAKAAKVVPYVLFPLTILKKVLRFAVWCWRHA